MLEGLSTKRKEDDFLRRDRIEVLLELAERGDKNRLVEAEAAARTARELIEKTPFTPDGKADFTRLRLRSIRVHAECLTALGRVKEARAITEEALKWIETLDLNPTERIERSEIIEESTLLHLQNYRSMRPAEFDEDMRFKVSGTVFEMKGRERTWRGPSDYWKTMTALLELETSFTENHINIRISYLHELATVLECRTHRNPHDLALREAKARAYGKLGDVAYEEGRRWISSHGYWRAIATWESLRISQPRHVETWTEVGWSMDRLGHMSLHEKRPDEARTRVHQAIALQKVARNLDPGNQRCLELLVGHLHLLIECCLALNDHGEAVETVKYLATLEKETAASRRRLAGLMAQGAAMVGVDTKLKPEERRAKSNEYADEAMRFLTRAVTLGHKDRADLQKAADLASLHTRDDFKALLNSLDRAKP